MRALSESRFDEMQDKDICFFFLCLFVYFLHAKEEKYSRRLRDDCERVIE